MKQKQRQFEQKLITTNNNTAAKQRRPFWSAEWEVITISTCWIGGWNILYHQQLQHNSSNNNRTINGNKFLKSKRRFGLSKLNFSFFQVRML